MICSNKRATISSRSSTQNILTIASIIYTFQHPRSEVLSGCRETRTAPVVSTHRTPIRQLAVSCRLLTSQERHRKPSALSFYTNASHFPLPTKFNSTYRLEDAISRTLLSQISQVLKYWHPQLIRGSFVFEL